MNLQTLLATAHPRPWHARAVYAPSTSGPAAGRLVCAELANLTSGRLITVLARPDLSNKEIVASAHLIARAVTDIEGLCRTLLGVAGMTMLNLPERKRLQMIREAALGALDIVGWDVDTQPANASTPTTETKP